MAEPLITLSKDQFDRMMRAVRFVEGMQMGPVRGQEVPEPPPHHRQQDHWVKVTGAADAAFRPEDANTDYYPCVTTEKVVLSAYEELSFGPLADDYWIDYDGVDDEEARVFSANGATLVSGQRYRATIVDQKDDQYAVLLVEGGSVEMDQDDCLIHITSGGVEIPGSPAYINNCPILLSVDGCELTVGWVGGDTTTVDLTACIRQAVYDYLNPLCATMEVVTDVECDEDNILPTVEEIEYLACPLGAP